MSILRTIKGHDRKKAAEIVRKELIYKYRTLSNAADKLNVTTVYLSRITTGHVPIPDKVAARVGLKRVEFYVKK